MAETITQKLLYLIEAQDKTAKAYESATHRMKKTGALAARLSKEDRQGWKEGTIQLGKEKYLQYENYQASKLTTENKRHDLALDKMRVNQQKRLVEGAMRFKMHYLGMLFFGMQVQKSIGRFFTSSFVAYNAAFEETSALQQQTNKLAAAWQFFQFTLMDALSQSELFRNLIDIIVGIVEWFANLDKEVRTGIIVGLGLLYTASMFLFVGSQLALGLDSINKWLISSGISATTLKSNLSGIGDLLSKIAGVVLISWAVKNIYEDITDATFEGVVDNIINAAMLAFGMKLLFKTALGPVFWWVFAITTAFEIIVDPTGFGKWVIDVANNVLLAVEAIGKVIRAALFTIEDMFTGKFGMERFKGMGDWFEDFFEGAKEEVVKLDEEGKLSMTLGASWADVLAGVAKETEGIGTSTSLAFSTYILPQYATMYGQVIDITTKSSELATCIDTSTKEKIVPALNTIGESQKNNQTLFNTYKTGYDNWQPADKYSTHYIRTVHEGGGLGFSSAYETPP